MVDSLIDVLIGWLVGWMIDWLIDWLIDYLIYWLICWLTPRMHKTMILKTIMLRTKPASDLYTTASYLTKTEVIFDNNGKIFHYQVVICYTGSCYFSFDLNLTLYWEPMGNYVCLEWTDYRYGFVRHISVYSQTHTKNKILGVRCWMFDGLRYPYQQHCVDFSHCWMMFPYGWSDVRWSFI